GHRAVALQGNMSQNARDRAMSGFRSGRYDILVATDIVARGIDVEQISHVINFDVPNTPDAYTHRIGRTGRSERSGKAYTFVTEEDRPIVRAIERKLAKAIPRVTLPGFEGVSIPAENFGGGLPEFRSPRAGRRGARNGEPGRGRESRFQDGKPNRRERGEGWSSETRSRAGGRENGRDGQRSRAGRDGAVRDGAGRAQGPRDSGSFRDRSRPERGDGRRENGRRRDDGRERAASGPRGDRREQARGERRTGDRSAPARPSGRGGRFDRGAPEMERGGRRGPRKAKRPPRRGS
ncbi:MAG TPA: helicase-related protein, partial [Planctomycetota bacterium]|nr:helicase-related protein [Planctomycetota bacterium]